MNTMALGIAGSAVLGVLVGWSAHAISTHLRHKWVEVSRTHTAPVDRSYLPFALEPRDVALHVTGFTTVLFRCEQCNVMRSFKMAGEVHQPKVVPLRAVKDSKGPYG